MINSWGNEGIWSESVEIFFSLYIRQCEQIIYIWHHWSDDTQHKIRNSEPIQSKASTHRAEDGTESFLWKSLFATAFSAIYLFHMPVSQTRLYVLCMLGFFPSKTHSADITKKIDQGTKISRNIIQVSCEMHQLWIPVIIWVHQFICTMKQGLRKTSKCDMPFQVIIMAGRCIIPFRYLDIVRPADRDKHKYKENELIEFSLLTRNPWSCTCVFCAFIIHYITRTDDRQREEKERIFLQESRDRT